MGVGVGVGGLPWERVFVGLVRGAWVTRACFRMHPVCREPRRPRFVTVLLYLNESWPDELHAETLFLDPASQAGVFVRPAPGRCVRWCWCFNRTALCFPMLCVLFSCCA